MEQVSTRELLQELTEKPIGSRKLQGNNPQAHCTSAEALEAAKRAVKIWLPQGRKAAVRSACNVPAAEQIDIEDVVEAAGGKRGGRKAA